MDAINTMDTKETIIRTTIALIEEKGEDLGKVTVREISKRAGVGLGLVNYHFENKDKLIELCVERIINRIVEQFQNVRKKTKGVTPFERLERLGNVTFDFLFEHPAISRISVLTDMKNPKPDDNTHRTYAAYLPLVAACRPDWEERTVKRKTFCLITVMQQAFLRSELTSAILDVDLNQKESRRAWHAQILHDVLEVSG